MRNKNYITNIFGSFDRLPDYPPRVFDDQEVYAIFSDKQDHRHDPWGW